MHRIICLGVMLMALAARADIIMDAAEFDRNGIPLVGFAAVRVRVDQKDAAKDVRFKIEHTGDFDGYSRWLSDDPENPYLDAPDSAAVQVVDGAQYISGFGCYPATDELVPVFVVDLTPKLDDPWNDITLTGEIPAGVVWDVPIKVHGDVKLFHSPAVGSITIDGVTSALTDDNPIPQSAIPEPTTLALLATGGLVALKRR